MPITLITVEEEDALPADDAEAFVKFERICRDQMVRITEQTSFNDPGPSEVEVKSEYMAQIRAALSTFGQDDMLLPPSRKSNEDFETYFQAFYEATLIIAGGLQRDVRRSKAPNLVTLKTREKAALRNRLQDLRDALELSDLSQKLKVSLGRRLDLFEMELRKERADMQSILATSVLVMSALSGAAELVQHSAEAIGKVPAAVEAITRVMTETKMDEIERSPRETTPPEPQKRLPSPGRAAGDWPPSEEAV